MIIFSLLCWLVFTRGLERCKPAFLKAHFGFYRALSILIVLFLASASCIVTRTSTTEPTPSGVALSTSTATPLLSSSPGLTPPNDAHGAPVPRDVSTEAPDRDLYELARSLVIKNAEPISRVVNPEPVSYQEGHTDTFWLTDITEVRSYTTEATLRLISPHAYWYVEKGMKVSQKDLEKGAKTFEERIYPRVTAVFGTEWTPGVDNDPHLTILHARLKGVAGYYSSVDEYPISVHQHSNQREIIYINAGSLRVGSLQYLATLAHELQHAIHWNNDPSEETWVNEGLSEVAVRVASYTPTGARTFTTFPSISLVHWPEESSATLPHYGSSSTFFEYLAAHYGPLERLGELVKEPADGIAGINIYLTRQGFDVAFRDVFSNWVVANLLDLDGNSPYSHPTDTVNVRVSNFIDSYGMSEFSVPQYAAHYAKLDFREGDLKVTFQGQSKTPLLPVALEGQGCWWSNRGDSISSTLTRPVDLSHLTKATLSFRLWFEVEEDWDYGYVQISTDEGITWDIINTTGSSPRNPVGNSFGPGYTGSSDGWIEEKVNLTPYTGDHVLLRFHYATDEAVNATGLCIDRVAIPEIGFSDEDTGNSGWEVEGFVRTDNQVPQEYIIQVVEQGDEARVRQIILDKGNHGEMIVEGMEKFDRVVVVVAALAPKTSQPATFTLTLEPDS